MGKEQFTLDLTIMIRVTEKITETNEERAESLHYIESINEKKSLLDLKDPYEKKQSTKRGTFHPENNSFSEDIQ